MLAIDWGTSSLRMYRLADNGAVRESRSSPKGILNLGGQSFPETLEQEAGDWLNAGDGPVVMSGMVGSRQGWKETGYIACPAGAREVAAAMHSLEWVNSAGRNRHAWMTPGLCNNDATGTSDVMRGEETQIFGILDELDSTEHRICLPGTHSKWATVEGRQIVSFSTHMTGEVFAVLKKHSILGRTMNSDEFGETAFIDGIARSADPGGLLHHLFGVRAEVLMGKLPEGHSAAYLSGILIGHELRSAVHDTKRVHLMGAANLTRLYALAAETMQLETVIHDESAVTRGLFALAQNLPDRS